MARSGRDYTVEEQPGVWRSPELGPEQTTDLREPAPTNHHERPESSHGSRAEHREQAADCQFQFSDSEARTLVDIGTFRALTLQDLSRVRYGANEKQTRLELNRLIGQGLIRRSTTYPDRGIYLTLTRKGQRAIEGPKPKDVSLRQVFYHGFVKPREAKHDVALYQIYQAQAERIARAGGRVDRVVLDFELKKSINRKLAKLSSLPQAERSQRTQEVAQEHGLWVVNGKIPIPDVRSEYETAEREIGKVDLELARPLPSSQSRGENSGRFVHLRPARGRSPPAPGNGRPRDHAGDFLAMNIMPAHLAALCRLGYSEEEATFIYLVATHSGYFTRPQFLRFTRQTKGGSLHRFTTKLLALGHVRATEYGRQMLVFHLYSRLVYGPIGKDNLRNRRRLSNELVWTRLLILDFVLANLDSQYLETETAKVSYFHEKLRLPLAILPGRRYTGLKSAPHTDRYFVDRFPIFISRPLPSVPTFVYCDSDKPGLRPYLTHLRANERLWRRLERFNFTIYAAPSPKKFRGAEAGFSQMFAPAPAIHTKRLARYFEVRFLWESHNQLAHPRRPGSLARWGQAISERTV
jgi:DNA-binding MarR family transcriptional regulator